MGRPRKKARDLTTEEAVKRLFPRPAITQAKKEARKADEQATKRKSK
jgi:hypothetical protein